ACAEARGDRLRGSPRGAAREALRRTKYGDPLEEGRDGGHRQVSRSDREQQNVGGRHAPRYPEAQRRARFVRRRARRVGLRPKRSPPRAAARGEEAVNDVTKERIKKFAPWVGFPIFYLFCLVLFASWTFPYDKLKERIVLSYNQQQRES